jgi:small subunit ribosomal protein S19
MVRSIYKLPFINYRLFELIKFQKKKKRRIQKAERIFYRSTYIHPIFLNQHFLVHTGKTFHRVEVQEEMIGHKFGEFASTRRRARKKIIKKKNKK